VLSRDCIKTGTLSVLAMQGKDTAIYIRLRSTGMRL
jgi:hypothetical protein